MISSLFVSFCIPTSKQWCRFVEGALVVSDSIKEARLFQSTFINNNTRTTAAFI